VVKVSDVMTRNVVSVTPDTPFKELVERLVDCDVSGLPVVDETGKLVGIVTEADLVSKEAYGGHRRRAIALLADVLSARDHHWVTKAVGSVASDVMSRNPVVCSPTEDIRIVARRMLERAVKRVPVVEDAKLVGIVSRHDLLATFARPDEAIAGDVGTVLTTHPNRPDEAHIHFTVDRGVVTLTGDVRHKWDRSIVISLVREVRGVIDVVDHLHSREPEPALPTPWTMGV
jgi:CBS domain-containing protein